MNYEPAIQARDLVRRFDQVTALAGVDLLVEPGEIYGLVGPDGSGKTTMMRILAGIMAPTAGEVLVLEEAPRRMRDRIGYMPQRFGLYDDLTVLENLEFYAALYGVGKKKRQARLQRLLGFSQLEAFRGRRAGRLSGGMRQKLALSCVLIHTPRVLLLDEPTCGVDPVSRRDFWRILYELLREGVTIFVSTAYLDEAERCQRVGLLHEGRLLAGGPPETIMRRIPGKIFELQTPDSRAARAILAGDPEVLHIALFGQKIHLALRGEARLPRILGLLREGGIRVTTWRETRGSLEDAFIAMLEHRTGEA